MNQSAKKKERKDKGQRLVQIRIFARHLRSRLSRVLRHLLIAIILQVLLIIVVRCHLDQPGVLNLDHLSHVLLSREDKLMVDEPPWQRLKQTTIRMDVYSLLVLGRFIRTSLTQLCRMIKKSSRYCFTLIQKENTIPK